MTKRISTAAYLAGVTTIAVSLPMMASAKAHGRDLAEDTAACEAGKADYVQVEHTKDV